MMQNSPGPLTYLKAYRTDLTTRRLVHSLLLWAAGMVLGISGLIVMVVEAWGVAAILMMCAWFSLSWAYGSLIRVASAILDDTTETGD